MTLGDHKIQDVAIALLVLLAPEAEGLRKEQIEYKFGWDKSEIFSRTLQLERAGFIEAIYARTESHPKAGRTYYRATEDGKGYAARLDWHVEDHLNVTLRAGNDPNRVKVHATHKVFYKKNRVALAACAGNGGSLARDTMRAHSAGYPLYKFTGDDVTCRNCLGLPL